MVSMKRNHELFWILEVLLLTPVVFFWLGVVSMMLSGSDSLFQAVVGEPASTLRSVFVTLILPIAAVWFAYDYLRENKKEKGTAREAAKWIIIAGVASIALVVFYLFGENRPR